MHLTEMSPEMEQVFVTERNQDWANNKISSGKFLPNAKGQYVMIVMSAGKKVSNRTELCRCFF